jgi:YVTN family beta-propeller protein
MRYNILLLLISLFVGCKRHNFEEQLIKSGYPIEVGTIITTRCAVNGCHTSNDKKAASGLSLQTWEELFDGANSGASVIPYSSNKSPLFSFINIHPDLGVINKPTMPVNQQPLTRQQIITIKNWIDNGAKNYWQQEFFSDKKLQNKAYITNQGCDLVAVMDLTKKVITRYIQVGILNNVIESPHQVKITPDNKKWIVTFINGSILQVFSTADDKCLASVEIGLGNWNTVSITPDSKKAFVVDWSAEGRIACIDLENYTLIKIYQGPGFLTYPHGSCVNKAGNYLYVTAQTGNFIYKIDISDPLYPSVEEISLGVNETPETSSKYDAHEIIFNKQGTLYFVTCQTSNEVRVMDALTDQLVKVIPVGIYPLEMAIDETRNLLFVTCTEDAINLNNAALNRKGVVSIIDLNTLTLIKHVYTGFQPHGIAVDYVTNTVWVSNRNISPGGPAPHHVTDCLGKNGSVAFINLNKLEVLNKSHEMSVDPYTIAIKQ